MKWLNFIPLLVWCVSSMWVFTWDSLRRIELKKEDEGNEHGKAFVFFAGIAMFGLIGILTQ